MSESLKHALQIALACAVVGAMAAFGLFDSIQGFPLVFAAICLLLGLHRLWTDRPRRRVGLRSAILVLGMAVAVGGWLYGRHAVDESRDEARARALEELAGREMPSLVGLEPINVDQMTWQESATFDAPATIVTFWARWCTPCEREMPVLETFYREHRGRGLRVLAVTRFGEADDEAERREVVAKAQAFLQRRDLTFPSAVTADESLIRAYRAWSIPRTILLDEEGRVVDYAVSLGSVRELMGRAQELLEPEAAP